MQVAAEVRRTLMKDPHRPIPLDELKLKFKTGTAGGKGPPLTPEQRLAVSKAAWISAVGPANVKKITRPAKD